MILVPAQHAALREVSKSSSSSSTACCSTRRWVCAEDLGRTGLKPIQKLNQHKDLNARPGWSSEHRILSQAFQVSSASQNLCMLSSHLTHTGQEMNGEGPEQEDTHTELHPITALGILKKQGFFWNSAGHSWKGCYWVSHAPSELSEHFVAPLVCKPPYLRCSTASPKHHQHTLLGCTSLLQKVTPNPLSWHLCSSQTPVEHP